MTDDNKFFRWLWRINAILIAGVGLAAITMLMFSGLFSGYHPDNFEVKPNEGQKPFEYTIEAGSLNGNNSGIVTSATGSAEALEGTGEAYLFRVRKPAGSDRRVVVSSMSYFSGVWPVNILMLRGDTGQGQWLFSGDSRIVDGMFEVHALAPAQTPAPNPVKGLLITVTDADTDGDGALTDRDRQSLYTYKPGHTGVTKLLAADRIISLTQTDAENVLVVYRDGQAIKDAVVSTGELAIRLHTVLPAGTAH